MNLERQVVFATRAQLETACEFVFQAMIAHETDESLRQAILKAAGEGIIPREKLSEALVGSPK